MPLSTIAIKPLSDQNKPKPDIPRKLEPEDISDTKKDSLLPEDSSKIDIDNYEFQSEFEDIQEPRSGNEGENETKRGA